MERNSGKPKLARLNSKVMLRNPWHHFTQTDKIYKKRYRIIQTRPNAKNVFPQLCLKSTETAETHQLEYFIQKIRQIKEKQDRKSKWYNKYSLFQASPDVN